MFSDRQIHVRSNGSPANRSAPQLRDQLSGIALYPMDHKSRFGRGIRNGEAVAFRIFRAARFQGMSGRLSVAASGGFARALWAYPAPSLSDTRRFQPNRQLFYVVQIELLNKASTTP